MSLLGWLPAPREFRDELKAALSRTSAPDRLDALVAIARTRLGLVETIQLDNALRRHPVGDPPHGFRRERVALLSSATVDHLPPALRVAGLRRRLLIDVHTGGFGQYRQALLAPDAELRAFAPDFVLLSLGAPEIVGGIALTASAAQADAALAASIGELRELWRLARTGLGAVVIQQTLMDTGEPVFGSFDRRVPGSPSRLIARANDLLAEAAAADSVLLLDVARFAARDGIDVWFDRARWLQGKIEIAPPAAAGFGELAARLLTAHRGLAKKCLVLDLDNTLWGGVVGDVGVEGIVLGAGSAAGEAHLALQRHARTLSERGVILAVCSKNEPAIVEAVWRDHPEMLLQRADIAAFAVNWTDKAENLQTIARELNLGLDSLVFVDDNPAERARVREALPAVEVPELPDDPGDYVRCIADAGYFEAVTFTDEDRQRAGQYAANAEREALRGTHQSMDEFLRGLDMSVVYGSIRAVDLPRATQLVNKTNQFNTTTRRYSGEEMEAIVGAEGSIALQFRLLDRFGDNGLVSVMLLGRSREDPTEYEMINWVMSCRVFGRQLEDEAMNIAVEIARAHGARRLRAEFIPTPKNGVINDLFSRLGFAREGLVNDGPASRWRIELADYQLRPTHISRKASA